MGEPSGIPWGWLTVNSPRTSTGCVPSGVSIITGWPSASSRKSSQWWDASASCQSTSIFKATAEGTGSGPVMLQPPPRMYNFPSDTCAASQSSMVTFTLSRL